MCEHTYIYAHVNVQKINVTIKFRWQRSLLALLNNEEMTGHRWRTHIIYCLSQTKSVGSNSLWVLPFICSICPMMDRHHTISHTISESCQNDSEVWQKCLKLPSIKLVDMSFKKVWHVTNLTCRHLRVRTVLHDALIVRTLLPSNCVKINACHILRNRRFYVVLSIVANPNGFNVIPN